jgi:hypothetical protein
LELAAACGDVPVRAAMSIFKSVSAPAMPRHATTCRRTWGSTW